jgi:TatD DNase family protein
MVKGAGKESSLVDTHCHVDLFPDPYELVRRIEAAQVYTIAVTNAPSVFRQTAALVDGKRFVRPAIGLHPELASQRTNELNLMWQYLPKTRYVGEVGLDYTTTTSRSERAKQRKVFEAIISRCHEAANKVLTVHSRSAAEDVVDAFGEGFQGVVILHWYSGSRRVLSKAISRGFYFSVNTAMIGSKKWLNMLKLVPREQILTESDGPFVRNAGAPARPEDVASVVRALAKKWQTTESESRMLLYQNFARLLRNKPVS